MEIGNSPFYCPYDFSYDPTARTNAQQHSSASNQGVQLAIRGLEKNGSPMKLTLEVKIPLNLLHDKKT
ncbi:hypothetical protein [Candidatus Marinarcus aquaticus]|uniref:Uncharacterized protein n=1 Tax=Candidatus Marinarcus aquaticus TaxID=2044504 RepID=A0A4Q0XR05_9BACT|nr:hypothetical protein [Candidatus Marinarcus aquaticus]RXJ58048.1 hypothetical protein CRV04_05950 [Candidatus Marinarcus aquaticus]